MVPCAPEPRNPKCYVCSEKREVMVTLNAETFTLKAFEEKVGEAYLIINDLEPLKFMLSILTGFEKWIRNGGSRCGN